MPLEHMECDLPVSAAMMVALQYVTTLRTACPEEFMLLWSFALLADLIFLQIYKLHENSKGLPSPHWLAYLEQINALITTLGKNLEMQLVSYDHHSQKHWKKTKLLVKVD